MLEVERLSKRLGDAVISDISFEVDEGEYFVLLGASGVGKTVLLEMITGIITPDSGRILLCGRDITNEKIQKRNIGLVFQNQALFPHLSVRQNIAYGLSSRSRDRFLINKRIEDLAEDLEIVPFLDRKPDTLSGGEAQRVALARALATEPECLLLDEPLSSLDTSARSEMRALLRRLNREKVTMVHVTHDYEEAISLASRIGVMEGGSIVQIDTPKMIFRHPKSEFVAGFIGIRNFFPGRIVRSGGDDDECARFVCNGIVFRVLTDAAATSGNAIIRSEDVTISLRPSQSSARNVFEGTVKDIFPVRLGIEVIVDIGVEIAALVTQESVEGLGLQCGKKVFASIKASAIRFLQG